MFIQVIRYVAVNIAHYLKEACYARTNWFSAGRRRRCFFIARLAIPFHCFNDVRIFFSSGQPPPFTAQLVPPPFLNGGPSLSSLVRHGWPPTPFPHVGPPTNFMSFVINLYNFYIMFTSFYLILYSFIDFKSFDVILCNFMPFCISLHNCKSFYMILCNLI